MPYPPIQTPGPQFYPPPAPAPQPQGLAARLGMAPQAPAFGSPVGQVLETVINVTFPTPPATSGFAVQRQTTSGPKYFPRDDHDPSTAARFETFAAARRARDEHSDLWRFNGQIVEASAIPSKAPAPAGRYWFIQCHTGAYLGSDQYGLCPIDPSMKEVHGLRFATQAEAEELIAEKHLAPQWVAVWLDPNRRP
jgi:hypothetical protein